MFESKGYTYDKITEKYKAQIWVGGRCKTLGRYDDPNEAHEAYLQAKVNINKIIERQISPPLSKSVSLKHFLNPEDFRVGVFDIETSGLFGNWDIVLCATLKTYGSFEFQTFKIDLQELDMLKAEKVLLEEIANALNDCDGLITYYGSMFDIPMVRTRCYSHGITPPGKKKHLDTYFTVRRTLNTQSKRLASVEELLLMGKPAPHTPLKTRLDMEPWMKTVYGRDQKSFDYMIDHNKRDVILLENVTNDFKPFLPDIIQRR
jgi:uncharacterized protein YprB with RNaseH-like and TPR domain